MPHARYKTVINAPYKSVSALLVDKMEKPKKYLGGVLYSSIVGGGDGFIIREMHQGAPILQVIKEKISHEETPQGEKFTYEFLDNDTYAGSFINTLTRVQGRDDQAELEYIMDWHAHPGVEDKIPPDVAEKMVELGVEHMKHIAENPAEVPGWVREFFAAADSLDGRALAPLLTEGCTFRVGNGPEIVGRDAIVKASSAMTTTLVDMRHDYVRVDAVAGATFVECWVEYVMNDGTSYILPFLTVFQRSQEKISGVKVFGDMSPLRHGWPTGI